MASLLVANGDDEQVLLLESALSVADQECMPSFMFVDQGLRRRHPRADRRPHVKQAEVIVRMGELAVSREPDDVLTTLGLGSCIGLAMLDPSSGTVGLAHIMLPAAPQGAVHLPAKFADTAVPALLAALAKCGSVAAGLEAVLIGGARMFAFARSAALQRRALQRGRRP